MPDAAPSLCQACSRMRPVATARSRFLLCTLSQDDPRFPKYPPQPVLACVGFRPGGGRDEARPPGPPGP